MQRIAVGISDRVNALTARQVLVEESDVRRALYQPSNYYSDGFHPGDGGYATSSPKKHCPPVKDGAQQPARIPAVRSAASFP
jgi:hypothetical protein